MLPKFPQFKKLELADRAEIERLTSDKPPYSDFNFTSLWSWNIKEEIMVSELNDDLLIRFTDYITGDPFYSFIGKSQVENLSETLINLAINEGINPMLKLIPEVVIGEIDRDKFDIVEDPDNFDYVLSVERILPHDGSERRLSTRRRLINEFRERKDFEVVDLDLNHHDVRESIMKVFEIWENELNIDKESISHLKLALERLFQLEHLDKFIAFGLYLNKILVGYSINEPMTHGYMLGHFQQANINVFGAIYALLMQEAAIRASHLGIKHINIEQDLGIEGLRSWKSSYSPEFFLKKYIITPVDNLVEE